MRRLLFLAAAIIVMLPVTAIADSITNPASSFSTAKKIARDTIYADHATTFYCGCAYTPNPTGTGGVIDVPGCSYEIQSDEKRGNRLEWEHVVPAARLGQWRQCWQQREQFPECYKANGKLRTGRDCCLKVDAGFKLAHNDLHNLTPSVGEVNADRLNYPYGIVEGEDLEYGTCDFELGQDPHIAEPAEGVRGNAARIWLYMAEMHGTALTTAERRMFELWAEADAPDDWERERDSRIQEAQGNGNPFVE